MPAIPRLAQPIYIGRLRYWKLSDIVNYERELHGEPPLPDPDPADERYLSAAQLRHRFGDVSDMWIWRRLHEADAARSEQEAA